MFIRLKKLSQYTDLFKNNNTYHFHCWSEKKTEKKILKIQNYFEFLIDPINMHYSICTLAIQKDI